MTSWLITLYLPVFKLKIVGLSLTLRLLGGQDAVILLMRRESIYTVRIVSWCMMRT